jgi:carbonic anhydrase
MTKINAVAMHGFSTAGTERCDAVTITGDDQSLTLTKGPALHGWLTDETKIATDEGETTVKDENMRLMQQLLVAWLRGEEFNP